MRRSARYVAAALLGALFLLPLFFMVAGSLRIPGLPPPDGFEWLPEQLRWSNYRSVFGIIPVWTYMRNSLVVVSIAVPVTVLLAS